MCDSVRVMAVLMPSAGAPRHRLATLASVLLLCLVGLPGAAHAQHACGDKEFDLFDGAATVLEALEERQASGGAVDPALVLPVVEPLGEAAWCEGRLGRRALLYLARAHTLRGDGYMEQVAVKRLRRRALSAEELKDLDARYPPHPSQPSPPQLDETHDSSPPPQLDAPRFDSAPKEGSGIGWVTFDVQGQKLHMVASTDELDAVHTLVVRWNPTGGGWLRVVVKGEPNGAGSVRFDANLALPRHGKCYVRITARRRGGRPAASSETVVDTLVDTRKMGRGSVRRDFTLSAVGS